MPKAVRIKTFPRSYRTFPDLLLWTRPPIRTPPPGPDSDLLVTVFDPIRAWKGRKILVFFWWFSLRFLKKKPRKGRSGNQGNRSESGPGGRVWRGSGPERGWWLGRLCSSSESLEVRRGCKRCSPAGENQMLSRECLAPVPMQQAFGPHAPKHLLHPLLTSVGTFEVPDPCSRHSWSQVLEA